MDNESIKDVLRETTVSVLETAAFLFIDDADMELPNISDLDMNGGEIHFSGFCNGNVVLWMAQDTADITARNMLGIDDETEIDDRQRKDAVLELLNIITGNLLTTIFGDQVIFKLSVPECIEDKDISETLSDTTVILSAEMFPLVIGINISD